MPEVEDITEGTEAPDVDESKTSEIEAETTKPSKEEEETTPEKEPTVADLSKKLSGLEKKVTRLTDANARMAYALRRRENVNLEQGEFFDVARQPEKKTPKEDPKPKQEDFETYEEFMEALGRWSTRDENAKSKKDEAEQTEAEKARQREQNFYDKLAKGNEKFNDFENLVFTDDFLLSKEAKNVLMDIEDPVPILYHLAKNPDEMQALTRLGPVQVAMAIGKLEQKLNAGKAPQKPKKEPAEDFEPPDEVGGGSDIDGKKPQDMSHAEYRAWRKKGGGTT